MRQGAFSCKNTAGTADDLKTQIAAAMFLEQTGGNYAVIPMTGRIGGAPPQLQKNRLTMQGGFFISQNDAWVIATGYLHV